MAYSFSQIQTYLTCPLKYRYEKIDKIKPETQTESLHLILGSTVHETLEYLYKQIGNTTIPDESELHNYFQKLRNTELERVNTIHGENYFDDEVLTQFFNRGEKYINRYYTNYHPFDQAISMKTEENINFTLEEILKFRGKVDRLDVKNDTMTIVDYKTSKSLPKDGNNSIEEQITLYGIAIQNNYGKQIKKIMGKVIYLHLEREYQREITKEKIDAIKTKYYTFMKEIEDKKTKYQSGDQEIFEAKSGYHCQNCSFMQICPLYKHQFAMDEEVDNNQLSPTTIRKLIEQYVVIHEQFKYLEGEKKLIAQILTEYATKHNYKNLYSDSHKINITSKESYSLNKSTLIELEQKLEKLGLLEEVQNIDYHKLGKKFKTQELEYDNYTDFVEKKITSYISRVGKKK